MSHRTVAEVLAQRRNAVHGGCCNRFADQMGCSCLEDAVRYEEEQKARTCWLCKKLIKGKIYYQGGNLEFPSHRGCLVVIKRAKDGGL